MAEAGSKRQSKSKTQKKPSGPKPKEPSCASPKQNDQDRGRTRVNIGSAFDRWRELRALKNFKTNAEFATFLLDSIDLTKDGPASTSNNNKAETTQKLSEEDDGKLSLISWNLDGLDTENLPERARGFLSYLALYTPDVVLLQELIPPYIHYLKKRAVSYTFIEGGEEGYFTGIMLKKSRVRLVESEIVPYHTTRMMRNLLIAQVNFKGHNLCLMTSHFESCKAHAEERMKQLRLVMQRMTEAPDNITVLFAGDTNLRDTEVTEVGLPSSVCDVWEQLGKQEHCRYTWDTKINSNKSAPYVSRCRFDRIYFRPAAREGVPHLAPDHMALVGLEKLDCGCYTSDHWGIYCSFSAG